MVFSLWHLVVPVSKQQDIGFIPATAQLLKIYKLPLAGIPGHIRG
jgi:hypothetical protein